MYVKYDLATYLCIHWFCMHIYIQDEKNYGVASHFNCFHESDCAATEMDILVLLVPWNGFFSLSSYQYQEIYGLTHWTQQTRDSLIVDTEKQGIQQKHATIAMETALCSVVQFYTSLNITYEFMIHSIQ